jgi:hypothetical protein
MRAGYGEKLRKFFLQKTPIWLIDLGGGVFESATVDTNILLITNKKIDNKIQAITIKNKDQIKNDFAKYVEENFIVLNVSDMDKTGKQGWFIGSSKEIDLKRKIEKAGKPLKDWDVKIYRGILTGLNEAFIINKETRDRFIAKDPKSEEIIKPILRGRDIKRYSYDFAELYILQTGYDLDIPKLYPIVYDHLLQFKKKAEVRDDQGKNWWNLRACVYYEEFEKEKVVWGNISYDSCFCYSYPNEFVNAPANMITSETVSIKYLVACLNSKIFNWEFKQSGIFLGKAYEWKKQYVEKIHIPSISEKNETSVKQIENLVDQILKNKKENKDAETSVLEKEIDDLVYGLYGLTDEEIKIVEGK